MAPLDSVEVQAWNYRVKEKLDDNLEPICKTIHVRTEFSGAGTAEAAISAAVGIYNTGKHQGDPIRVEFKSLADWDPSARRCAELNHPTACCFGDIMGLVPEKYRNLLEAQVEEKAR